MISQLGPVVGGALVKRWTEYQGENPDQPRVPNFSAGKSILSVFNLILLIPVFLYMAFTLGRVFPTLAMVEDPLPKYDAIPITDPNDDGDVNKPTPGPAHLVTTRAKPITSSLRATHRLLSSIAGWRSQFRGLGCYLFQGFLTVLIAGPLIFIIGPFGHLAALLILTRFSTGLTHIIITKPSDVDFFKRLPPMRRTLTATYIPILFHWLAAQASIILPHVLAYLVAFDKKQRTPRNAAKLAPIAFLGLAMHLFLVFPSYVALVRVQASLLPHEEETIVPFDRSFGGRVEPQVVSGKGFASFRDALATVPRFSWIRLYVQQVKIIGVTLGLVFLCLLLGALEFGIGMALFH